MVALEPHVQDVLSAAIFKVDGFVSMVIFQCNSTWRVCDYFFATGSIASGRVRFQSVRYTACIESVDAVGDMWPPRRH